jgi:hypothetical protein
MTHYTLSRAAWLISRLWTREQSCVKVEAVRPVNGVM